MKQLFHIENSDPGNVQQVLSLRVGERHASFVITDKTGSQLYELAYCTAADWNGNEWDAFSRAYPILDNSFYEVLVSWDHPVSMLIPSHSIEQEKAGSLMETVYGRIHQPGTAAEMIPGWQLHHVFTVPPGSQEWINRKFPAAKSWHQYSIDVRNIAAAGEQGVLQVDFRTDDFTVVAARQSKLLLARSFDYSTPGDVIYYLLQTCRQFSLSQLDVQVHLTGLIDQESALYKELYQYFIQLDFREPSWQRESEFPAHFFTSLNDLARCAS